MKPLVIFHDNCADGFGAAFAAWLKFDDEAEYLPAQYGREIFADGETVKGRDVYVLDFSFDKKTTEWLFETAASVTWLDHHRTAFEMWCGEVPDGGLWIEDTNFMSGQHHITLDDTKSGAMIAWNYFHPDVEVPMLIKHIDDYDRWSFNLRHTKEINKAIWSYAPWCFETWEYMVMDENYGQLITEGAAILRAHDRQVHDMSKNVRKCTISFKEQPEGMLQQTVFRDGLTVNAPSFLASDVGHELATQSGTFGLVWHMNDQGKISCSLRSNGDYDVSAIAKAFGGGGHKNAAGFETDAATLLGWMK